MDYILIQPIRCIVAVKAVDGLNAPRGRDVLGSSEAMTTQGDGVAIAGND